jgi:RHS repeat-associated protein
VRKEIVPAPKEGPPASADAVRVVEYLWDQDTLAQEIDTDRGKRVYVQDPASLAPLMHAEHGEVFTYVNDHLGAPREILDRSGRAAWGGTYSAWGRVVEVARDEQARSTDTPFRLLGQYHDEETGLAYVRFRYFDPDTARWLSPDPVNLLGGRNVNGFNGAPTVDGDPLGLCKTARPMAPKGTRAGDRARYRRYVAGGGKKSFKDWFPISRGGRSGGPGHQKIQAALEKRGLDTEVPFGDRFADAASDTEIHQIGGLNERGDPIARERDAIQAILDSPDYNGQTIYFWDKTAGPKQTPITNPQLLPNWGGGS